MKKTYFWLFLYPALYLLLNIVFYIFFFADFQIGSIASAGIMLGAGSLLFMAVAVNASYFFIAFLLKLMFKKVELARKYKLLSLFYFLATLLFFVFSFYISNRREYYSDNPEQNPTYIRGAGQIHLLDLKAEPLYQNGKLHGLQINTGVMVDKSGQYIIYPAESLGEFVFLSWESSESAKPADSREQALIAGQQYSFSYFLPFADYAADYPSVEKRIDKMLTKHDGQLVFNILWHLEYQPKIPVYFLNTAQHGKIYSLRVKYEAS